MSKYEKIDGSTNRCKTRNDKLQLRIPKSLILGRTVEFNHGVKSKALRFFAKSTKVERKSGVSKGCSGYHLVEYVETVKGVFKTIDIINVL